VPKSTSLANVLSPDSPTGYPLGGENLPSSDNLGQWNGLVILPLADQLLALYEYGKALAAALVEDLGGACVSTSHF
jgi:hypothetical protein